MTTMANVKSLSQLVPNSDGSVELSVDEGGVRCDWRSRHAYIPLAAIADVSVDATFFGGSRLVLTGAVGASVDGNEIRLHVTNATCVAIQRVLLVALEEQRNANRLSYPPALARENRPIEEWLGDVARHATGNYRDAAFDHEVLAQVLADVHGDIEARAAAAYALLASGDDEHLVAVTRVFIMHAVPPLVLAAARAAAGGPALIPEDVVNEVAPYLPDADVEGLVRMAVSNTDREARVTAALDRAKVLAAADARREQEEAAAQAPKWRRLHMGASGVDTRWVGKTWAL